MSIELLTKKGFKMNYIGLDLSLTATGVFVVDENSNEMFSREIKTKPNQFDTPVERCYFIANTILEILKEHKPDYITIEEYFVGRQPKTVIRLAELGSIVRFLLLTNGYDILTVAPTKLKKFVTGKGNCGKELILKDIFKKFNVDTNSNNIADAAGLAFISKVMYFKENNLELNITKYQDETTKKLENNILKNFKIK